MLIFRLDILHPKTLLHFFGEPWRYGRREKGLKLTKYTHEHTHFTPGTPYPVMNIRLAGQVD